MERVADRKLPGVDQADDVAGVRDADGLAVAPEKAVRAARSNRPADAAVEDRHVLREPARADADERDAVAVARIHVRLNLEDEPGELFVGGRYHADVARAWLRRRRQRHERVEKRLEAEIRERAAEEHRCLAPRQVV